MSDTRPLFSLVVETERAVSEITSLRLFEAGAAGLEEGDTTEGARFVAYTEDADELERFRTALTELRGELEQRLGRQPKIESRVLTDRQSTWRTEWKRYVRPVALTERIVVRPVHIEADAEPDWPRNTTTIVIEPSFAFGLGHHATTRMTARRLEGWIERAPDSTVLDVGFGSGLLSFVALIAGAPSVDGVEVDPVALDAASTNADLNGLGERCRFSIGAPEDFARPFDLVVANIDADTLMRLSGQLLDRLVPKSGLLIVAGIPSERVDEVAAHYGARGGRETHREVGPDWALLELARHQPKVCP